MLAHEMPEGGGIELLRTRLRPRFEQSRHTRESRFGLAEMGVHASEREGGLPGVLGLATDRGHQPRATD